MAFKGGVVLGTVSLNATGTGSTNIGATSNSGTVSIGNASSTAVTMLGPININATGALNTAIGSTSNSGTVAIGNTSSTSVTIIGPTNINTTASNNTAINSTSSNGTVSIGNTSSGAITINCGTAGITIGTTANTHASTFGSTTAGSTTIIQAPSGGVTLTGVQGFAVSNRNYVTINTATGVIGSDNAPLTSISITGDSGGALTGSAFTFTGGTTGLTFAGAGTTETLGGTLVVSNGGTGRATLTNHGILIGAGTTAITQSAVGTNGQVFIGASAADPGWVTPTAGSGLSITTNSTTLSYAISAPISIANGGTNATSMATTDGTVYFDGTRLVTTATGTSGQVLTSAGAGVAPSYTSLPASSISVTGDSGGALTGAAFTFTGGTTGLTFSGAGSTETLTGTLVVSNGGTGRATLTNHGVLVGAGTTAITQLSVGATNSVLQGTTGADPAFTTTPTVTSITFGSGSALSTFVDWTNWTPTITGGSTAGTTTYSGQSGVYSRIGNIVTVSFNVNLSAATGTGSMVLGGLPFTVNATGVFTGAVIISASGLAWPTGTTMIIVQGIGGTTTGQFWGSGTLNGGGFLAIANTATIIEGSLTYRI